MCLDILLCHYFCRKRSADYSASEQNCNNLFGESSKIILKSDSKYVCLSRIFIEGGKTPALFRDTQETRKQDFPQIKSLSATCRMGRKELRADVDVLKPDSFLCVPRVWAAKDRRT